MLSHFGMGGWVLTTFMPGGDTWKLQRNTSFETLHCFSRPVQEKFHFHRECLKEGKDNKPCFECFFVWKINLRENRSFGGWTKVNKKRYEFTASKGRSKIEFDPFESPSFPRWDVGIFGHQWREMAFWTELLIYLIFDILIFDFFRFFYI